MTDEPAAYKPGDVVNGHMLSADGHWTPIAPSPSSGFLNNSSVPGPHTQAPAPYPHQVVYVNAENSNNTSLAPVTSLVTGLFGVFLSWIPFIGVVGWIFGPLALVFGILGLRRGKAEHKIMSWIGIVCGAITLIICFVYVALFASIFGSSTSSDTTF